MHKPTHKKKVGKLDFHSNFYVEKGADFLNVNFKIQAAEEMSLRNFQWDYYYYIITFFVKIHGCSLLLALILLGGSGIFSSKCAFIYFIFWFFSLKVQRIVYFLEVNGWIFWRETSKFNKNAVSHFLNLNFANLIFDLIFHWISHRNSENWLIAHNFALSFAE